MTSLRGTNTPTTIEAGSYDYSAVNARYTDTFLEDKITEAELLVEAYPAVQIILSATSADKYKRAVIIITHQILLNDMINKKFVLDQKKDEDYYTPMVKNLLDVPMQDDGIDIIPLYRPREYF